MAEQNNDNAEELRNSVLQRTFGKESVMNVKVDVTVVLGRSMLRVYQLLKLGRGAVIELNQKTNDPVEILANEVPIARGEVIVTDDGNIGVTLTELIKSKENASSNG
ncbi:surface presentation of antigens (SPOA) protein [Acetobacter sp. CAG:977]|nr:surface presentation of antigens (SPOA) protein [Acetobacter sp. CAG:977]